MTLLALAAADRLLWPLLLLLSLGTGRLTLRAIYVMDMARFRGRR
jgi:hypothetical protein